MNWYQLNKSEMTQERFEALENLVASLVARLDELEGKNEKQTYTAAEVCQKLGIARPTLNMWMSAGKIAYEKAINGRLTFTRDALENVHRKNVTR